MPIVGSTSNSTDWIRLLDQLAKKLNLLDFVNSEEWYTKFDIWNDTIVYLFTVYFTNKGDIGSLDSIEH